MELDHHQRDDAVVDAKRLWTQKQREHRAHKNNGRATNEGSHIHGLLLATPVHRQSLIFLARTSESSQFQSSECSLNNATTFRQREMRARRMEVSSTTHNSASSKNYTILQIEKHSSSSRWNFILFDKWLIIITVNFDSYGKTVDLLVASSQFLLFPYFLPLRVSTPTSTLYVSQVENVLQFCFCVSTT